MPGQADWIGYVQPTPGQGNTAAQPTYPVQNGSTNAAGSSGGLVNVAAQVQSGVQNGMNMANQAQQMQRATQNYNESQAYNKGNSTAGTVPPAKNASPTGDGHADFMSSVLKGLHSLGTGVENLFGVGKPAIPTPPNSAPAAAAPAPAAAPPATGAPAPMQDGGPIRGTTSIGNMGVNPQFQRGGATVSPDVLAFQRGGAIPAGPAMGVVQGATDGIPGFADGGPVQNGSTNAAGSSGGLVNVAAQVQSGVQNGMNMANQAQQMQRAGTQYSQDQTARAAGGVASVLPQDAQAALTKVVDGLAADMHAKSLNDDHKPNEAAAIPTGTPAQTPSPPSGAIATPPSAPTAAASAGASDQSTPTPTDPASQATAQAVQAVAQDPTAQTGRITTTPSAEGKPHSITMEQWDKWDQNIDEAVRLGALAGHDPGQVRASLEANRNAYIQGHVLRYLSAANVNLLNGDQKGVEQALRNAYYYMPDGQNLNIQKDKNGTLLYQDPIKPYAVDANGQPDLKQPNMIPVDAAHIQMLGQAMLDPMNVQTTIQNIRSFQSQAMLRQAESQRDIMQGNAAMGIANARNKQGDAALERAKTDAGTAPSKQYLNLAEGDKARASALYLNNKATATIKNDKLDPALMGAAQHAAQAVQDAIQGPMTTVPVDPTGASLNPAQGKSIRDPSKSAMPGASAQDVVGAQSIAQQIVLGSRGAVPEAEAARLAILAQQAKKTATPGKPGDAPGKVQKDFVVDKSGTAHVWNKAMKKWETFQVPLSSASNPTTSGLNTTPDDLDGAAMQVAMSGSGQGAISTPEDSGNSAEDYAQDQGVMTAGQSS